MKKKSIIITLVVVLSVLGTVIAFGLPALDRMETLRMAGELEQAKQEAIAAGQDYVVARGNNIEVKNAEVARIEASYSLTNSDKGRIDAINAVAKRAALEAEAIRQGYSVTEQEVQSYVEKQIDMMKGVSNYDELQEFLDGAQMTLEEYFYSQYDILKQELLYNKMLDDMRVQLEQQPSTRSLSPQDQKLQINEQIQDFKAELLEAEDLIIIE